MFPSTDRSSSDAGAQLNFNFETGCCPRHGLFVKSSRDQVEVGARDGCILCRYIEACISWAFSYGLISNDHIWTRSTFGGNLELFGTGDSTPVVELQCWRRGQVAEIREDCGRTVAYGDPKSLRVPSNAQCFPLPSETSSWKTFAFLKKQLNDCVSEHAECRFDITKGFVSFLHFRLLEIRDTSLKLVSSKPGDRYACLSHCWGVTQSVTKTTRGTLKAFSTSGIVLRGLPKTFHDAVRVCCNLGIRLIWIDSLCIVQDDSSDWLNQAQQMADIFDNAYLTIAASKARDSASGCFSKVDRVYRGQPLPGFPDIFIRHTVPLPLHSSWAATEGANLGEDARRVRHYWPLLTRAWVFQEILLSKRVVHFGVNEVSWQCSTKIQQQGTVVPKYMLYLNAALPRTLRSRNSPGSGLGFENHDRMWHILASDYSTRELTFSEDRLPAISAIARYMSGLRQNDAYMAGLWHHTMINDLTWSIWWRGRRFSIDKERSQFRIPTWSWASCSGAVVWNAAAFDGDHFANTEILTTTCTSEGGPFTGRITHAAILIKAALVPLLSFHCMLEIWHPRELDDTCTQTVEGKDVLESLSIPKSVQIKVLWDQGSEAETPSEPEILALSLLHFRRPSYPPCTMTCLLIQATATKLTHDQVEDPRYGKDCYKRVGTLELWLEGDRAAQTKDESKRFDDAREVYISALVKHVEALGTHVITLV
jgi:hypothetical protein